MMVETLEQVNFHCCYSSKHNVVHVIVSDFVEVKNFFDLMVEACHLQILQPCCCFGWLDCFLL